MRIAGRTHLHPSHIPHILLSPIPVLWPANMLSWEFIIAYAHHSLCPQFLLGPSLTHGYPPFVHTLASTDMRMGKTQHVMHQSSHIHIPSLHADIVHSVYGYATILFRITVKHMGAWPMHEIAPTQRLSQQHAHLFRAYPTVPPHMSHTMPCPMVAQCSIYVLHTVQRIVHCILCITPFAHPIHLSASHHSLCLHHPDMPHHASYTSTRAFWTASNSRAYLLYSAPYSTPYDSMQHTFWSTSAYSSAMHSILAPNELT